MGELAPRWVEAGHEVIVYCRKALFKERPAEWQGIKLVYLPSIEHKAFSTLSHSFLATVHASVTASDVILTWNAGNGPFGWFFRIAGKTAVINVDGMEWLRPKWKGIGAVYFKWAAKMATAAFPIVITDASEMKRLYLEELGAKQPTSLMVRISSRQSIQKFWRLMGLNLGIIISSPVDSSRIIMPI